MGGLDATATTTNVANRLLSNELGGLKDTIKGRKVSNELCRLSKLKVLVNL